MCPDAVVRDFTPRDFMPPPADVIAADVARALAEDIGSGDVTADLLGDHADDAYLLCKEDAIVCGRPWFDACHRALDPDVRIDWRVAEGDRVAAGTVLATLTGRAVQGSGGSGGGSVGGSLRVGGRDRLPGLLGQFRGFRLSHRIGSRK